MTYDVQYKSLVMDIIENGYSDKGQNVRTVYADGEKVTLEVAI